MQIKYSPQCSDRTIEYQFQGEIITAILNGEPQTIDLSSISQYPEFDENEEKVLDLPFFVLSVKVDEGVKKVELLRFHKENAPESERFGFDWEEV